MTVTQLTATKADSADRRASHPVKRLGGRLLTAVCAAALIAVVAFVLLPGLLGLQRFVITGGSMTGTIPKGAVIYSKVVPAGELKVGDIITFTPPGFSEAVTHRIIGVEAGPDGKTAFRTKGDFNEAADPWNPVTLNEPQQARYVFQVPLARLRARGAGHTEREDRAHRRPRLSHRPLDPLVALARGGRGARRRAGRCRRRRRVARRRAPRRRPARRSEPGLSRRPRPFVPRRFSTCTSPGLPPATLVSISSYGQGTVGPMLVPSSHARRGAGR